MPPATRGDYLRGVAHLLEPHLSHRLPDPARRRVIEELFDRVFDASPDQREALLAQAGREDPALRREVERLLADSGEGGITGHLGKLVARAVVAAESESPVEVGEIVASYEVLERLGSGGMGVVYQARDLRRHQMVALKFLPSSLIDDQDQTRRFLQEAKAAAALDHPNVCTIHSVEQAPDGRLFIVMPYYDGSTIQARLADGPLPIADALNYARQTAAGLAHAHAAGIVHRDVKPANLAVTAEGLVKILDFGIAKVSDVKLTRTGMVLGTLSYMSPEQASAKPVDHRTDLWSLGVVLYQMLAGVLPFTGPIAKVFQSIQFSDPAPVTDHRADTSAELAAIVHRHLEKDRERRYADATSLLAALGSVHSEGIGA